MSSLNENPLLGGTDTGNYLIESNDKPTNPQKTLFFLLGNSSLLAFNIIINAIDIYMQITKRPNIGTELNRAYNIPCSITAFILCVFKPKNFKISIVTGLVALMIIMTALPFFFLFDVAANPQYYLTIITIGLTGIFSCLVFSSANSFASQFGQDATAAVSSGNGCCGVIAAALRIITKASVKSGSHAEKYVNAVYFFIAAVIFLFTLFFLIYKLRNPEIASRVKSTEKEQSVFSRNTLAVIQVIWVQWVSIFINYAITLSLFPGYVTLTKEIKSLGSWTPVIVSTLFCIFDWVGRAIPGKLLWPARKYAWIPIALRLSYYLIFIISIQRVVNLGDPWWTFAWMIPFGISNGMGSTVQVIYGANHDELSFEQRKYAGLLVSFAINAGILAAMGLTAALPKVPE